MKTALLAGLFLLLGLAAGLLLAPLFANTTTPPYDVGSPVKEIPELLPLANWAGEWDTVMTARFGGEAPRDIKTSVHARWVLDGRFIEQYEEHTPAEKLVSIKLFLTYDTDAKVYRSWIFFGFGAVGEATGKWDAATRTMTWTSKEQPDGKTTTTISSFPEDGVEVWSVVERDRAGDVVSEVRGKNTRRK